MPPCTMWHDAKDSEVSNVVSYLAAASLQPTQQLCNQLAKAWGRQGEIGEVRAIMANMRNSGIQTDVYTWSSLVYACAVAGQMGK